VLVSELRQRVVAKVAEAASSGDEETTANVLNYSRATLIALAVYSPQDQVDLHQLTVTTATAARILSLHPEYIRALVRRGFLRATKASGEFQIPLEEVVGYVDARARFQSVRPFFGLWMKEMLKRRWGGLEFRHHPPGEDPAEH
jgi:excisionase family DNA binding protein